MVNWWCRASECSTLKVRVKYWKLEWRILGVQGSRPLDPDPDPDPDPDDDDDDVRGPIKHKRIL